MIARHEVNNVLIKINVVLFLDIPTLLAIIKIVLGFNLDRAHCCLTVGRVK